MSNVEKVLARRQKQKMLSFGAFIGCLVVVFNAYAVMKPYLPLYFHVERRSPTISNFLNSRSDAFGDVRIHALHVQKNPTITNLSNSRTDVYDITGDVRIHGISTTVFIASTVDHRLTPWNIRPYPRKNHFTAMRNTTNFKIITKAASAIPRCTRNLSIPAILFSTGGLAGNHFHAFTDVLVPLFLTSYHFNRSVLFLATNYTSHWTSHYRVITEKLSNYDLYDIDHENEVLCFSRMIIGLRAYKDLEIVPSESDKISKRDFIKLLNLKRESLDHDHRNRIRHRVRQPRMLIISREETRRLRNEQEVGELARSLGFEVAVKEMGLNVSLIAEVVNSFDVLVGVHGAGLSNMVFLPENAVLIQIVPFGLDYMAKVCFDGAVESNKLKYLRYDVGLGESSLLGKYPPDSLIYRNPTQASKNFTLFRIVYLDSQDVNLDLGRFRGTLLRALEIVLTN